MSWSKKVAHPSEIVKKGDKIETIVLSVDKEKKRVSLGIKQLKDDPWKKEIPEKYSIGDIVKGKVTKIADFGAFLDLGDGLEGLLHISELSNKKIDNLEKIISIGDELDIKIIKMEPEARKIGLSIKDIGNTSEGEDKPEAPDEQADTTASDSIDEEKVDDVENETT
jgi:small subunit ribosomal protein S1